MFLSARAALAVGAVFLAAACGQPPNESECAALLDRYVTLLATSDRPDTNETELIRLRAEARQKAARDPAFRQCPKRVSRHQLECALAAENADRFEQCLL